MPYRLEVYKCNTCGNIVEIVYGGYGQLDCCGKNMQLMTENSIDAATEKHVPVIEFGDGTITVKVGSEPHPMQDTHHIKWIELVADGRLYRQYLKLGAAPEATFTLSATKVTARDYCNLHGHWEAQS